MSEPTPYWLIGPISYQDAVNLSASDLITNFQRDPRKNDAKFWPGNQSVLTYLRQNLPDGSAITNAEGTQPVQTHIKAPVVVHKRTGRDIDA